MPSFKKNGHDIFKKVCAHSEAQRFVHTELAQRPGFSNRQQPNLVELVLLTVNVFFSFAISS